MAEEEKVRTHPVQVSGPLKYRDRGGFRIPEVVALRAYEVYSYVYGAQPALIDLEGRNCRGGFGDGELVAFLYAHSFPKAEWRARVEEAFKGMQL
jgi:hypothetical protein